ncbi:hypothetical protein HF289_10180 [Acidithiobacillus ferrooxidans]|uniref:hypothetical protein n=1 Tax=Acidithiobacillus ferrooxidans TaxID=920 RepID=UPI001C07B7EF|nr:hypothetical protein [Acidithiobacillus ferrooxidans]MBU2857218.1 hypothetical protein [Acidithiobacillus ferrooxidans]
MGIAMENGSDTYSAGETLAEFWRVWRQRGIRPNIVITDAGPLAAAKFGRLLIRRDVLETGNETLIDWLVAHHAAFLANPWLRWQRRIAILSLIMGLLDVAIWHQYGTAASMVFLASVMAWLSIWTADQYAVRALNARRFIAGLKAERAFAHQKESWLDTRRIRLMRGESFF